MQSGLSGYCSAEEGVAKRLAALRIRRFPGAGAAHGRDIARMARSYTVSVEVMQGFAIRSEAEPAAEPCMATDLP
jgi:hypothetical protein